MEPTRASHKSLARAPRGGGEEGEEKKKGIRDLDGADLYRINLPEE